MGLTCNYLSSFKKMRESKRERERENYLRIHTTFVHNNYKQTLPPPFFLLMANMYHSHKCGTWIIFSFKICNCIQVIRYKVVRVMSGKVKCFTIQWALWLHIGLVLLLETTLKDVDACKFYYKMKIRNILESSSTDTTVYMKEVLEFLE